MRALASASLVLFAAGCWASHELGGPAGDSGAADGPGAGTCGAGCSETPPPPDLGLVESAHVGPCALSAATTPAPFWAPCFRPCDGAGPSCTETPLSGFEPTPYVSGVEHDGHAYFGLWRHEPGLVTSVVAMDAEGHVRSVARVAIDAASHDAGSSCSVSVDALSDDAWAFTIRHRVHEDGGTTTRDAARFFGALDAPATWSTPATSSLDAAGLHSGVVTPTRLVVNALPEVWTLDASGGSSVQPTLRGTLAGVVAAPGGRPVWLEETGSQRIVAHRTPGGAELLHAPDLASVELFGTDGPAFVWIERDLVSSELVAYTAPIVDDAAALRPRRVADAPETHWGAPVGDPVAAAFDHARIAVVQSLGLTRHRLLVVDITSGFAHEAYLAARRIPVTLAFAGRDHVDVVVHDPCGAAFWLVRFDVAAMAPLDFPTPR